MFVRGENVCRFGHEMDTTEHDVLGIGFGSFLTEHERVAKEVCMHDYAIALIVVAKNQQVITELLLQLSDSLCNRHILRRHRCR